VTLAGMAAVAAVASAFLCTSTPAFAHDGDGEDGWRRGYGHHHRDHGEWRGPGVYPYAYAPRVYAPPPYVYAPARPGVVFVPPPGVVYAPPPPPVYYAPPQAGVGIYIPFR
jgi:hypothetical protein